MAIPTSRTQLLQDIQNLRFGVIEITPTEFASYVEKYVHFGSQRYHLSKESLTVYRVPAADFEDKSQVVSEDVDGIQIPSDLNSHLICGTKFLDAVMYMHLPDDQKPTTSEHDAPKKGKTEVEFDTFDDHVQIAKSMFYYYFYLLTRARAPEELTGNDKQPIPKFLNKVLSITSTPGEIAEYIASFDLTDLDPAWVRGVKVTGLSQESLSRFGLGVAGYRLAAPFKLQDPDGAEKTKYAAAIMVARSFATSPACWDFHPATRTPNLLQKYGNINKNLANLILKVYKKETIDVFVKARIIYEVPEFDPSHTNYTTWDASLVYSTTAAIFPSVTTVI